MSAPTDVEAVSQVKSAVVFEAGAQVFRETKVTVPKGLSRILFDGLPSTLKRDTLQVSLVPAEGQEAALAGVVLKGISVEKIEVDNAEEYERLTDEKREKMKKCQSLKEELPAVHDELSLVKQSSQFIKDAMNKAIASGGVGPEDVSKLVETTMTHQEESLATQRTLEAKIKDIEAHIDKLTAEFCVPHSKHTRKEFVTVLLDAKTLVPDVVMQVSYLLNEAKWTPAYDIRVRSPDEANPKPALVMQYNGVVEQWSSEAWTDAKLSLSTAKPTVSGQQPNMSRWVVKLQKKKNKKNSRSNAQRTELNSQVARCSESYNEALDDALSSDSEENSAMPMAVESAEVNTAVTSQSFTVAGKQTVSNDSRPHRLTLTQLALEPTISYVTVPSVSEVAFAQAKVVNTSDYFLLPGETSVFLNDQYLAKSKLKRVSPGESFTVDIGSDEGIIITHKLQKKVRSEEGGTFSSKKEKFELHYGIKVTNRKGAPIVIKVKVPSPVSHNSDIHVKLLEPTELATTETAASGPTPWKDEEGILHFCLSLKPHESQALTLAFKASVPEGRKIDGFGALF